MRLRCIAGVAVLAVATVVAPVSAQTGEIVTAVTIPIEGRFAAGGEFTGTATVNRFEQRGDSIVAVGLVTGTLRRGNRSVGSLLAAGVTWTVALRVNGTIMAKAGAPAAPRITPAHFRLAQGEPPCEPVQIVLGPTEVSVFGVNVAFSAVTIDLTADVGAPLGDLVCQVGELIGNVAGLLGVLNNILGLLTGLLEGVTGVVGGIVP
jgi:hypothetical protein